METTSCVKAVVMAVQQYRNNPNEANLVNLQRQLDVLISITCKPSSLRFFDTRQLLPTECFTALVDLMNDNHINTSLAQKTMGLLSNLAQCTTIRKTLHTVFNLTSSLATFLKQRGTSPPDHCTTQCIELLQKITYNQRVPYEEHYVDDLVRFLVKSIISRETSSVQACLGLLANVCRHNRSVQAFAKSLDNMKAVYKTLISYLSHHDMTVVVFSMSILISLCLHEELGEKLFNSKNIHQTFQLIFNIILTGDTCSAQSYAVDLFIDLIKDAKICTSLVAYDHLGLCIKRITGLLSNVDCEVATKLFELLLAFCNVSSLRKTAACSFLDVMDTTLIKSQPTEAFYSTVQWADQTVESGDMVSLHATDFLQEMYKEMLKSSVSEDLSAYSGSVLPLVKKTLSTKLDAGSVHMKKKCQKIVKVLQLLSVMCDSPPTREQVCETVSMNDFDQLLDYQFTHNRLNSKYTVHREMTEAWSDDGMDVMLLTLQVLLKLKNTLQGAEKRLASTLQDTRIVPFLSQGMTSSSRNRVNIVLNMVAVGYSLESFPSLVLGDAIAAFHSNNSTTPEDRDCILDTAVPSYKKFSTTSSRIQEKENIPLHKKDVKIGKKTPAPTDAAVQQLIEKMQAGMELKDVRNSEIIDVYEHKLQSLQTKENHLQDLLEAKALALAQADRLISQYRCRRAQSEAEAHKLSSLVQESERMCEENREKLNDVLLDRERQQTEIEHYVQENQRLEIIAEEHKELTSAYTEQTNRLENTLRSLATLKQEHTTMSEMHEMLRRHNETLKQQYDVASQQLAELEEERKVLTRQLKEKESKIQDTTKQLQKQQQLTKKLETESSELETAIDKLRSDLGKTEQAKKSLTHQVSSLEVVCRQHEADIKDKDTRLTSLQSELDKHAQIAALIHGLSSGKVPPAQVNM